MTKSMTQSMTTVISGCDIVRRVLQVFSPKTHNLILIMRKTSGDPKLKDILQNS